MSDMKHASQEDASADQSDRPSHRARLPGFIIEEDIGLGDVIKRAVSYAGIQPCGGCARRAAALNHWLVFTGRHQR